MRWIVAVLLLAPAWPARADPTDDLPPPFEPRRPPGLVVFPQAQTWTNDAYEVTCGGTRIARDEDGWRVRVLRADGSTAFERHRDPDNMFAGAWDATWCLDLDGDGTVEVGLYRGPGTSHGSAENWIVSLGPRPRVLFRWVAELSNGMLTPADLDGRAPWELVGDEDSEQRDGDVCGSAADRPGMPVVVAKRGARWVRATARFPAHLRALRAHLTAILANRDRYPWLAWCSFGAPVMGLSLLLGDWAEVRPTLDLDEEEREALEAVRRVVHRRMNGVLRSGARIGPR